LHGGKKTLSDIKPSITYSERQLKENETKDGNTLKVQLMCYSGGVKGHRENGNLRGRGRGAPAGADGGRD
jgi:hypothetical protein